MSTLLGTDADETILPGNISPSVTAVAGPLVVGADADVIIAGGGNDTVNGGAGNDTMLLGSGNDRAIWNPGDGSDVVDGGAGDDIMEFNGAAANERMVVTALTDGVVQLARDVGNINMTLQAMERIQIQAGAGDDTLETAGNLAGVQLTLDGGAGNDRILGGNGVDLLLGGDGNDFIDGNQGADTALMGAGDDVFQWDPGDGSDVVEGQDGRDTMLFNGNGVAENFEISANGGRARFTRNVGNITMDINDVEVVDTLAGGGADNFVVNDLTGTDVREVNVNLAEATAAADTVLLQGVANGNTFSFANRGASLVASGTGADVQVLNAGAEDLVIANGALAAGDDFRINGDEGAQNFHVTVAGTDLVVEGLAARIGIRNDSLAADTVTLQGGAGDDSFDVTGNAAALAHLVLDGGAGNDRILGGNGADVLIGGEGNDFVDGQQGNDNAFLGAGNDVFQWDPGDGSDVIDGGTGNDTHVFNGAGAAENFALTANGGRVLLTRNVGNITMDQDNFERVEINTLTGADDVSIGDMRGTDVRDVRVDFAGTLDGTTGDGVADSATIAGTSQSDRITLATAGVDLRVSGLAAQTRVANLDAIDSVTLDGGAGSDIISATQVAPGMGRITLNGGAGNDTLLAGRGGMTLNGGAGNDVLVGGSGDDILIAGTGRDVLAGGSGNDLFSGDGDFTILDFRAGRNAGDRIDLSGVAGIDDFGDVMSHVRHSRVGVVLDFGDDEITLLGVTASQLVADDFLI